MYFIAFAIEFKLPQNTNTFTATKSAKIEANSTAAAEISLIFLAKEFFSVETKSTITSKAVLKASQIQTSAIEKPIQYHSKSVILKKNAVIITQIVAAKWILALFSDFIKDTNPSNAKPKLFINFCISIISHNCPYA